MRSDTSRLSTALSQLASINGEVNLVIQHFDTSALATSVS